MFRIILNIEVLGYSRLLVVGQVRNQAARKRQRVHVIDGSAIAQALQGVLEEAHVESCIVGAQDRVACKGITQKIDELLVGLIL